MPSTPPLPVEIVKSPPADLLLELLSGLIGAIVAAVVSALVAVYVVRRAHQSERRLARGVASLAAAEALTTATWDLLDALDRVRGQSTEVSVRERRTAYRRFVREQSLNEPALRGYWSLDPVKALLPVLDELVVMFEIARESLNRYGEIVAVDELLQKEVRLWGSVFDRALKLVSALGEYRSEEHEYPRA